MNSSTDSGRRVLLTGGAGYVGSACLRYLLRKGYDAIAYDNLVQGHRGAVPDGRLLVGDIADPDRLEQAFRDHRTDAVMHFAAATCVGESVTDPEYHYRNNICGTLSLLRSMRKVGIRRLLFSSTCATYGRTDEPTLSEDTPQVPESPYARTKLAIEWMIRDFADAYGLGFTILRYFNAAGAELDGSHGEDHRPESHLIPCVLEFAMGKRDRFEVFGSDYPTRDGTCIRDYVHILDLAEAHELALENTRPDTRETFNVGTGVGYTVLEVIRACERAVGRQIPFKAAARRAGDSAALVANPRKIREQLAWTARHFRLDEIVVSAHEWMRRCTAGYGVGNCSASGSDGAGQTGMPT